MRVLHYSLFHLITGSQIYTTYELINCNMQRSAAAALLYLARGIQYIVQNSFGIVKMCAKFQLQFIRTHEYSYKNGGVTAATAQEYRD